MGFGTQYGHSYGLDEAEQDAPAAAAVVVVIDVFTGPGWLIEPGSPGDYVINSDKTLRRDRTVQTRCFLRIATRRGSYPLDPDFGSRLHLIEITKNADRQVRDAIFEALEPLIDDGSILDVSTEVEAELNMIKARVVVMVPGDTEGGTLTVGSFPIGALT